MEKESILVSTKTKDSDSHHQSTSTVCSGDIDVTARVCQVQNHDAREKDNESMLQMLG